MKDLKQIIKEEKAEEKKKVDEAILAFTSFVQCKMVCGDGSGKPITRHVPDCPVLSKRLEDMEVDI